MQTQTFFRLGKLVAPLSLAATLAFGLSAPAKAMSLGPASDYNVFILGDVTQSNTDSEGKMAVAGNVTFSNFFVGMELPKSTSNGDVLIVGKNLSYTNGEVNGNAVYGGQANVTNVTFNNGSLRKDSPIDFAKAGQTLLDLSKSLTGLNAKDADVNAGGGITLTGTDQALNVFNLSGAALSATNSLEINAPTNSTVVVNVSGADVSMKNFGFNILGTSRQNVLYNFYEAKSLSASGIGIQGSVLAPLANFKFNNGQINGNLIAASLTGGGQSNNFLFQGELPDPTPTSKVPEPATLAGLGLVAAAGVVSRRKGKQKVV